MSVFRGPGVHYNPAPWIENGMQLVPTQEELIRDLGYGKIGMPITWSGISEFIRFRDRTTERKKKDEAGRPDRPPERGEGGMYRADGILGCLDNYTKNRVHDILLEDAEGNYTVERVPQRVLQARYGGSDRRPVYAFEEGVKIILAEDAPNDETIKALAHEIGAKRLRSRLGYLNHPEQEDEVAAEGDRVLREYITRALQENAEMN